MSKENLKDTMGSLFDGMEGFLTSKTVVGEPIQDKSGGGIGGKMTPSAVLVIKDGQTKLVNIKNQETIVKLLDMVPDVIDKFTGKNETLEDIVDDLEK